MLKKVSLVTCLFLVSFCVFGQVWDEVEIWHDPNPGFNNRYASAIAIDGEFAAVGVEYAEFDHANQGIVYLYKMEDGVWDLDTQITAADGAFNDFFGSSIALNNGVLVVGAEGCNHADGTSNIGAAYIFELIEDEWVEVQKIQDATPTAEARFGGAIALDNGHLAIGATEDEVDGVTAGSVATYAKIDGVWTHTADLFLEEPTIDYDFGIDIAIKKDIMVIGAFSLLQPGKALVYNFVDDLWVLQQELVNADEVVGDAYGLYVATDGEFIAVSAGATVIEGFANAGKIYVYESPEEDWELFQEITNETPGEYDQLGVDLVIDEGLLVGGCNGKTIDGVLNAGAINVYRLEAGNFNLTAEILPEDLEHQGLFGTVIAYQDEAILTSSSPGVDGLWNGGKLHYLTSACHGVTLNTAVSESSVCLGDTVVFSGSGIGEDAEYNWTNGVLNNIPFVTNVAGIETYKLTAINEDDCVFSDSLQLEVFNLPVADITVNDDTVCNGADVTLTATGGISYDWLGSEIENGEPFIPETDGLYTHKVVVTDVNGCQDTSDAISFLVLEEIIVESTIEPELYGFDGTVDIEVSGGLAPYLYDWSIDETGDFDDDQDLEGLTSGSFILQVKDSEGCEVTHTIFIDSQLGVFEGAHSTALVYPNPAIDQINIELNGPFTYQISSISGHFILEGYAQNTCVLALDDLQSGVYLLSVTSGANNKVETIRIIKK